MNRMREIYFHGFLRDHAYHAINRMLVALGLYIGCLAHIGAGGIPNRAIVIFAGCWWVISLMSLWEPSWGLFAWAQAAVVSPVFLYYGMPSAAVSSILATVAFYLCEFFIQPRLVSAQTRR